MKAATGLQSIFNCPESDTFVRKRPWLPSGRHGK